MNKTSSFFICQQCGYESGKWFGKCPQCDTWGSLVETVIQTAKRGSLGGAKSVASAIALGAVSQNKLTRTSTKISELDRVLGGGLVAGQVVLIAGEPGIGKSTILLQIAEEMESVLYASGEESAIQIAIRADRLGVSKKGIELVENTDVDAIIDLADTRKGCKALIIDSIQTMTTSDLSGMAGSVGQVKESAFRLVKFAKSTNTPVFIVGQVTKQGSVAGPAVLMHMVDTVLWFEGDKQSALRVLRSIKNRFGPTDEVGVFSMADKGLVPMDNPEDIFLSDDNSAVSGVCLASVMQGTRPILVEIQSLVVPTKLAIPRRVAQGIDARRLELLLAVLTRRAGLPLYDNDCFVNVAGGMSIKNDPSSDLAVCLSIASSFLDKPVSSKTVAIGEVGLLGDIRAVVAQEKRLKEAKRLGYKNIITNASASYLFELIKKLR